MRRKLTVAACVLASVVLAALPAEATSTTVGNTLYQNQVTYYGTSRTITLPSSNIYFKKTSGPEMDLQWYKCSDRNVSGSFVYFEATDPTARRALGTGFVSGAVFCLASYYSGPNATDSFTGNLDYNVYS